MSFNKTYLNGTTKQTVIDALGRAKYWYDEMGVYDHAIYTTENHQILYHSSEYLLGQMFPNDTFVNSGMTGKEHEEHAVPLIKRWLNWRGQFGMSEWHSATYYVEDIAALVGLSYNTLRDIPELRQIIAKKKAERHRWLHQAQDAHAVKTPVMAIFLGKNELGQRDIQDITHDISPETATLLGLVDRDNRGKLPIDTDDNTQVEE